MYSTHRAFTPPTDQNATLWRYMDLSRLLSLLEREALFFASADRLGDPFEGIYGARNLSRTGIVPAFPLDPASTEAFEDGMAIARVQTKGWRKYICVNCWHLNAGESDAMWRLYGATDASVAIRTTFAKLCNAFSSHSQDPVYVGEVNYADYSASFIPEDNLFFVFLHKRSSFEHEHEVRAVVSALTEPEEEGTRRIAAGGLYVSVDLSALVEEIVISPLASAWFHDLVPKVLERYGRTFPIRSSTLAGDPPY